MRKILFVDDEPNVLSGLKRMLRGMRDEWEMTFVSSAEEALRVLESDPHDVVVSDMRMPVMDGGELLNEVMKRHPHMVRIVLSGQSEKEAVMRIVGAAHQYVSKPCDAETLKRTVARALSLRHFLSQPALTRIVAQIRTLASMPALYLEVNQELAKPDASMHRVGEIISRDPGMTAKVLQLVNSGFFGLPRRVNSAEHAAALLGADTLRHLVLTVGVFSALSADKIGGLDLDTVWRHSLRTASLAKQIAISESASRTVLDDATLAALLHDAGKLVLADLYPCKYRETLQLAAEAGLSGWQAEQRTFGAAHAEVGAYLLGLWGLPEPVVEAVAFHHCPGRHVADAFGALTAVHAANVLDHLQHTGDAADAAYAFDDAYLRAIGLEDRATAWLELNLECSEAPA